MSDTIQEIIGLMEKQEGRPIKAFLTVNMMQDLEFIENDVALFSFPSVRAYEDFLEEDDDPLSRRIDCHRVTHKSYVAKLEWLPIRKDIVPIIFSYCVKRELDKSDFEHPVLIIRMKPQIDEEGVFMSRFTLVEREWLQYANVPFNMETHEDNWW